MKSKKERNKRKNRKIKFSEENYIEKNYMKGKKAIIPVELESIDDLYMQHDYKKMQLSDSVCDYIEEIAYMIPINTDIILEIHCPEIDDEMQSKIKKNIKNNYGMEIDDCDYNLSEYNKHSLMLLALGIVFLIFNVLIENVGHVLPYLLSVIWWVAIWDMIEMQLMEKRKKMEERLNYQQLYDSTITFVFEK